MGKISLRKKFPLGYFRRNIIWVLERILPWVLMDLKESHSDPRKQLHLVLERVFPEINIIDRIFTRVKDAYSGSQKELLIQFAERFLLGYHRWIFNWIVRLIRVLGRIFPWVC